ncbi:P27 family phage terminase small subunit, partial [Citrobacter braakii]
RGIVFPGKSFFSAHEVSTCKISGCLSYRILDSGPDGTQTTLTIKPHPAAMMKADAWKRLRAMLAEFGMTPSSRSKVSKDKPDDDDLLSQFLNSRD